MAGGPGEWSQARQQAGVQAGGVSSGAAETVSEVAPDGSSAGASDEIAAGTSDISGGATGAAPFDAELVSRLRVAVGRIGRQLRQRSSAGLTGSQLSALVAVEARGSVRLGDLAAVEGIAPSTLSRIVASLEDTGLTARTADPEDRRSAWISLTAAGRRVLSELRAERTVLLACRVAALDPSERAVLRAALPALERLAGDVEGTAPVPATGPTAAPLPVEQPVGDQPVRDRDRGG